MATTINFFLNLLNTSTMVFILRWTRSQFTKLPEPTNSFAGQTIIVTGSNVGIGLEGARYLVRLGADKVILAVRAVAKGEEAKASIEKSEGRKDVVEVWPLDLENYESVKAFAARAESLPRLDVLVENAGVYLFDWKMAEGEELTITVNVISTLLLAFLMLPKLRETATKFNTEPVLSFTSSFVHFLTGFPERKEKNIFEGLRNKETARIDDRFVSPIIPPTILLYFDRGLLTACRYNVAKMTEMLLVRELAAQISASPKAKVITNNVNPGYVATSVMRHASGALSVLFAIMSYVLARTSEVGGRTLVHGAGGGMDTHGAYLDDCKVGT
jgi:retinol dehydrogenase-12